MIYFVHATLHIYAKDTKINKGGTLGEFAKNNPELIKRVEQEAINIFGYELSSNQIGAGIGSYLTSVLNPSSVFETEAYALPTLPSN